MPRGRPRKNASSNPPQSVTSLPLRKPSTIPRRQSGRVMKEIKNSSDVDTDLALDDLADSDTAPALIKTPSRAEIEKKVPKAVAIPTTTVKGPTYRSRQPPSPSPSSSISVLSSVKDQSMDDYDTPGTSAAVTPAESLGYERKARNTSNLYRGTLTEIASVTQGKRKRNSAMSDLVEDVDAGVGMDSDAILARAWQEEEYAKEDLKPQSARQAPVQDTDEEMEVLSALTDDPVEVNTSRRKRPKLSGRSSLPSRSARDEAKQSIRQKVSQILDSDESAMSDVSAFISEVDSDDFGESEAVQDSVDESDAPAQPGTSVIPSVAPAGNSRAAVRAANRLNRAQRQPRSRGGANNWRSRMADRLESRAATERAKLEKAHPEIKTMWTTLEGVPTITPTEAAQPKTITRKLKAFQLQGLDWMIRQEKSQWKGGLLGDEMGMGKTIQAVSLIMSDYPAKDPTLVVVPPVALMQWQNEIKEYTDGKLKVLVYHNTNPKVKNMKMKELKTYDVIMISYSGLESIYRKESKGWKRDDGLIKENSKIHAINFHRLILDEAHNIKTRTTGVARACFALKADFKWCLSGTPVQNRIGEFFSLLRFLEVRPFACYFCKMCPCAELHWSQNADDKKCTVCNHTGFSHVSIFNQELLNPITQGTDDNLRREALGKLRLITDRIMLRRMKRDHTASMELPPKEVIIHNEFFGHVERDFSTSIMSNTSRQFDTYVSRGVMLNNYANIFGLIMQMRQVANHPDLILKKHAQGGQNVLVCCICDETAEEPIRSRCHHEFCRKCAKDYVRSFEQDASPDCPRCHIPLAIDFEQPDIEQDEDHVKKSSIINRIKMDDWTSSTKIEMLVYDLYKLRSQKQTHKSIVFSQFTSMLQLVEWRLRRAGFNTVMLDGSMSPAQRQRSIEYFMNNTHVEVFLVSLKAGGVALNLTEASRVFIIDPWWNPAAEWQSADRCHRIGQKRPCVITRLCIEDSVESRMVMLQEKKANMINGTINNDQVAMEKLTPEDMQFLFRGS
ncbi:MAG: hypothetical protein Q9168_000912 [Polycauliona sp. 1 TL-2023]